jgi:hypothetical protein
VALAVLRAQSCSGKQVCNSARGCASRCVVVRSCASAVTLRRQRRRLHFSANRRSVQLALCRTAAVPFWVWLRITRRSSGRPSAAAQLYVRRRQYHRPMRKGLTPIAASVARVACLAAPLRRAACPSAVGATTVLRAAARASAVPGRPSVGGRRTAVQVPLNSRTTRKLERAQSQSRSSSAEWLQSRRCACAPALRVRSACAAFVLCQGWHRPAAHASGGVVGVGASRAEGSAVLSQQARAKPTVQKAPPNPSIERTNNGGQRLAVLRASRAPLFAAHVER